MSGFVPEQWNWPEWTIDAACHGYPDSFFFLDRAGENREAENFCRTQCPVRRECLIWTCQREAASNRTARAYLTGVTGTSGSKRWTIHAAVKKDGLTYTEAVEKFLAEEGERV